MSIEGSDGKKKPSLFGAVKVLVELAVLWAAFGYFSLRAFCNFNGIPLPPNLGPDAYVHESYTLAVDTLLGLFTSMLFLLTLVVGGIAVLLLPMHWFGFLRTAINKAFAGKTITWLLFASLLASAFLFGQINRYLEEIAANPSIAGTLSTEHLIRIRPNYYYWTVLLAAFSWGCFFLIRGHIRAASSTSIMALRCLEWGFLLFNVLTAFYIPLVYATSARSAEFYVVKLQIDGDKSPVCAVRLLETPTQMLFWHAENGVGYVASVPASRITGTEYLRVENILGLALSASKSHTAEPQNCGVADQPGGRP